MQRTLDGGIIISCDFCGTDWDPYDETHAHPMVEGHHGSIICLECVKLALAQFSLHDGEFRCTMCIKEGISADMPRWWHPMPVPSDGLNALAVICRDCLYQAAGKFSKDSDIPWKWEQQRAGAANPEGSAEK